MFITGPDVIKTVTGEEPTFEELGGAMTHNTKSGVAHFAAENGAVPGGRAIPDVVPAAQQPRDAAARRALRRAGAPGPCARHDRPRRPSKPYDMRDVISLIVDDGEFFEVHKHFAQNIVVGFFRLDGFPIGVVGTQAQAPRRR